jgi:hypothetical protein
MSQDAGRVAVCPQCEAEYLASAIECVECGVALVHPEQLATAEVEELPPASELTCIRAASVAWTRALSERLSDAGIPHRVEAMREGADDDDDSVRKRPNFRLPCGVYVRPGDSERAARIDADFMRSQIPDLPEGHEISGGGEDAEACPACGERVSFDTTECPSCGLMLSVEE